MRSTAWPKPGMIRPELSTCRTAAANDHISDRSLISDDKAWPKPGMIRPDSSTCRAASANDGGDSGRIAARPLSE